MASEWRQTSTRGTLPLPRHHIWGERMGGTRRRRRVEPTDEWEQIELLCAWPEQLAYEEIRQTVLFGFPVSERAEQTGTSERTFYRRASRFDQEGMDSLFDTVSAKRRELPPVTLGNLRSTSLRRCRSRPEDHSPLPLSARQSATKPWLPREPPPAPVPIGRPCPGLQGRPR